MSRRSPLRFLIFVVIAIVFGYKQWQKENGASHRSTKASHATSTRSHSSRSNSGQPKAVLVSTGQDSNDGHLLLGNPSDANQDENNYLLERAQYSLSFNHSKGEPNWVSWHSDSSNLGDTDRGKFAPDPDLPADWRVTPKDYTGSGYDRGHVCPSGDRTDTRENNNATFYMSNMLPQTGDLNRHIWAKLEEYLRAQIRDGNEVYEIAGGVGSAATIAGGKINVPKVCWKVAVIIPEGTGDLSRIDANTRVVSVGMPNVVNDALQTGDWQSYLVPTSKLETATGLKFFTALPADVRAALESKVDKGD